MTGVAADDVRQERIGSLRWTICLLLFLATMVNYMDRQIIGILKPELSLQLGWSEPDYANIVTAFQLAYALGSLFGGRFMDRVGIKRGLPVVVALWSLAGAAHGLVRTVVGFSAARLALGLAEGGNFPAAIKGVAEWFPQNERSLATGIFNSASNIGSIVCPLIVPALAMRFGWQSAFYIMGGLGLVWVALWLVVYDAPRTNPRLGLAERAYIGVDSGATSMDAPKPLPIRLLCSRPSLAYMVATMLASPVWWFYLFWLPDFLKKDFHLSLQQTGSLVGLVYTISIVGSVAGGWLPSRLIRHGWSVNAARKVTLLICALCVTPVATAPSLHSAIAVVVVVGIAAAAHQGWSANLYTVVSDCLPRRAISTVVGLGGFLGGLASIVVAQVVGQVLKHPGGYVPIFAWASSMYLVSLLILQMLAPRIGLLPE